MHDVEEERRPSENEKRMALSPERVLPFGNCPDQDQTETDIPECKSETWRIFGDIQKRDQTRMGLRVNVSESPQDPDDKKENDKNNPCGKSSFVSPGSILQKPSAENDTEKNDADPGYERIKNLNDAGPSRDIEDSEQRGVELGGMTWIGDESLSSQEDDRAETDEQRSFEPQNQRSDEHSASESRQNSEVDPDGLAAARGTEIINRT